MEHDDNKKTTGFLGHPIPGNISQNFQRYPEKPAFIFHLLLGSDFENKCWGSNHYRAVQY